MREKDVSNAGLIWRILRSSGRLCYHFHFKQAEILFLPLQNLLLFLPLKSINAGSREVLLLLLLPRTKWSCNLYKQWPHPAVRPSEREWAEICVFINICVCVFQNFLLLYLCISEFNGKQARPSEREWVNCNVEVKFATNQMSD